jgi:membrane protein YqaA with SNARE-associated domain
MFRKLYNWVMELAEKPYAPKALGAISFAESSFFPIPPDVMLVPMALARPDKALNYALICTVTSVLGGVVGYGIGAVLFETLGGWLITVYGLGDKANTFREQFQLHGHWVILLKGLTPIPYKLVTITSGAAGYSLPWFIVLSLLTRGARFYLLCGVMHKWGAPIKVFIEKNLTILAIAGLISLVGGFYVAKYLF